jgi:hypothetical protein
MQRETAIQIHKKSDRTDAGFSRRKNLLPGRMLAMGEIPEEGLGEITAYRLVPS